MILRGHQNVLKSGAAIADMVETAGGKVTLTC